MTHEDRGHYAKKHTDVQQNPEIAGKILAAAKDKTLDCASAHRIVKALACDPAAVGIQADLLEIRLCRCQMGLFGYGPGIKKLNPDVNVSEELKRDILEHQRQGYLPCSICWDIAKQHKISKIDAASACETLEVKIKPCQLGAF